MEEKYIVDRFEENYAVIETKKQKMINVNKKDLPKDIKPGDILVKKDGKYKILKEETEKRTNYIKKLTNDLWE